MKSVYSYQRVSPHALKFHWDYDIMGRETVTAFLKVDGQVYFGTATLAPTDRPNRKLGREIAFKRVFAATQTDKTSVFAHNGVPIGLKFGKVEDYFAGCPNETAKYLAEMHEKMDEFEFPTVIITARF